MQKDEKSEIDLKKFQGFQRIYRLIIWMVCATTIVIIQFYLVVLILKANSNEVNLKSAILDVY